MRPTFQILVVFVAAIGLTTGAAFGGGVLYGRETAPEGATTQTASPAATGGAAAGTTPRTFTGGQGGTGGTPTIGVVEQVDGGSMTVKTQSGAAVSVTLQPDTQITRMSPATAADIQPGDSVTVIGRSEGGGPIAARSVQIGGRGGATGAGAGGIRPGGGPADSPSPAPTP